MLGVQQWAEIRRLVLVERCSQREVASRLGLARDTVARAVRSETPPKYSRRRTRRRRRRPQIDRPPER